MKRMGIIRQNFHNHTIHSDGVFPMGEVLSAAEISGLEGIAITDHFYTSKVFRHMSPREFFSTTWKGYLGEVALQRRIPRKLKVWFGVEIDTCLERLGMGLSELPWDELNGLDLILLEYVGEEASGGIAMEALEKVRDRCRVPIVLAHPHLERIERTYPLETFFEGLGRNDIALEIVAGSRNPWFWGKRNPALLKTIYLTIGVDMHDNLGELGRIDKALNFLGRNGLLDRLVDPGDWKAV